MLIFYGVLVDVVYVECYLEVVVVYLWVSIEVN